MWNYVNHRDVLKVLDKLGARDIDRFKQLLRPGTKRRVENAWSHMGSAPTHWWNLPGIDERWNEKVTGAPDEGPRSWFIRNYLPDQRGLRGLSLGCGTGAREIEWARLGIFDALDGIDLSAPRIEHATAQAAQGGLSDILNFEVADLQTFGELGSYDVIIAEQSLHHFAPMDGVLSRLRELLHRDGFLYLDEFVGPTRFQWTDDQLKATNRLLANLPVDYRTQFYDGRTKHKVYRPSLLSMRLKDPSEAIESERILPELHRQFRVDEVKGYGGNLLHLAIEGIAQNFASDDAALIEAVFNAEDEFIDSVQSHDFVVAVAGHR